MATKYTKTNGTQRQIKAQNEEIHYIKSKIYQLIATNKTLRKELDNAKTPKQKPRVPLKNNTSTLTKKNKMATKYNETRGTQWQIKSQIEEIGYLKSKIYQLITTQKNLRKELDNSDQENQEKWQRVENRKRRNKTTRHAKKHSHTDRKRENIVDNQKRVGNEHYLYSKSKQHYSYRSNSRNCDSSPKINGQLNQNDNSKHNCH